MSYTAPTSLPARWCAAHDMARFLQSDNCPATRSILSATPLYEPSTATCFECTSEGFFSKCVILSASRNCMSGPFFLLLVYSTEKHSVLFSRSNPDAHQSQQIVCTSLHRRPFGDQCVSNLYFRTTVHFGALYFSTTGTTLCRFI